MSGLDERIDEDRRAVEAFVEAARRVPPDRWAVPRAQGKWSPGQVVEHVVRSYDVALRVLRGTSGLRAVPRPLRPLVRRLFLRPVLRRGALPARTKTVAAFEPAAVPADAEALVRRLCEGAEAFEREARERRDAVVDHPVFGRVGLPDYVRLNALHTVHHRAQLGAPAAP